MTDLFADVLGEARERGFLGPGDPVEHAVHARGLARIAEAHGGVPGAVVDLGAGGGVPGLVLAERWSATDVALVESRHRCCEFLRECIAAAQWGDRVRVVEGRGEALAHDPIWRERADLVVARSFGPPPSTAEIAAGFVSIGGRVLVSEPPTPEPGRWDVGGLERLGLSPPVRASVSRGGEAGVHAVILEKRRALESRYPRRVGVPTRRPLW